MVKDLPAIVLLRGLVRQAAHWGEFAEKLQSEYSGRVICLELPGSGKRNKFRSPTDMPEVVEDLRLQLKGLQIDADLEPVMLVGVSLGGMIAANWNAIYPQEIRKIILINSSFRQFSGIGEKILWPALLSFLRIGLCQVTDFICRGIECSEKLILELVSNDPVQRAKNLPLWIAAEREYPMTNINKLRQIICAAKMPLIPQTKTPSLVIYSHKDRLVSYRASEKIAAFLGSQILFHPWAGHDISVDDPDWLVKQILNAST